MQQKHGPSHGKQRTTLPPPRKVPSPATAQAPPTPEAPDALRSAARTVLLEAGQVLGHTDHTPACPSGGGGPCICGLVDLKTALDALRAALDA